MLGDENVVPYEYSATFDLRGTPGAAHQDVINVSPDGIFVAVAIGYGFQEERGRNCLARVQPRVIDGQNRVPPLVIPGDLTLGELPPSAILQGFRVNPRFQSLVFGGGPGGTNGAFELQNEPVPLEFLNADDNGNRSSVFEQMRPPARLTFLFSMVDSSTGRELQDEPTHNLASLGNATGDRPFRWLAQPITFMPRSTLRIQVVERTPEARGMLNIVLLGYKILGSARCSEEAARSLAEKMSVPSEIPGSISDRTIPFDYVTTFALSGRPGNLLEAEATVNVEGGFYATAIGYGLQVEEPDLEIEWENAEDIRSAPTGAMDIRQVVAAMNQPNAPEPAVNLASLPLRLFPASALVEGLRLDPDFVRIAFQANGQLANAIPVSWLDQIFERLNQPENVSFRYLISDGGRGRELQNEPIFNIAGLGTANGDRPFKKLARPLLFLPRSTIRVRIEEHFGRGTLFFVFQGYKVLNQPGGRL